jgi:tRNA(Ile)-lysidine synthase
MAGSPPTDLTAGHVGVVDALVTRWSGQSGVDLPGRLCVGRSQGELRFTSMS